MKIEAEVVWSVKVEIEVNNNATVQEEFEAVINAAKKNFAGTEPTIRCTDDEHEYLIQLENNHG